MNECIGEGVNGLPGGHRPVLLGGWLELSGAAVLLGAWLEELWFVDKELSVQRQTVPWGRGCPLLMRVTEVSFMVCRGRVARP